GTIMFTALLDAARSLADVPQEQRPFFSVVIDEFQNFASPLFYQMLPELRKFNLTFTLAHQFLSQLSEENRGATQQLTNHITFRVRPEDARTLAPFYAKSPPLTERREEEMTVPPDSIKYITDHGHPSQLVSEFVTQKAYGHGFNDLFRDVMRHGNPRSILLPPALLESAVTATKPAF